MVLNLVVLITGIFVDTFEEYEHTCGNPVARTTVVS